MDIKEYFETYRPDVIIFMETPFNESIYNISKKHNVKTVGIPMHETFTARRLYPDFLICPCITAYEKAREADKVLLFLPISTELFPFKLRTGHDFVLNIGYNGVYDRRQSRKIVEAFKRLPEEAKLFIHAQDKLEDDLDVNDPRITVEVGNYELPRTGYERGDILIAPQAYGGYERSILEGMASGMPVLTTNADPMCQYQHDPQFLVEPCQKFAISSQWVVNTIYNEVSVDSLEEKFKWLLTIDTEKYSKRAREQAVAQSWESKDIDYRGAWNKVLEELVGKTRDDNVQRLSSHPDSGGVFV